MRQTCMACDPPTTWDSEAELKDHLVTFHGTASMDEAVKMTRLKKKNTPVQLPPGVPETAAPTPEFTEIMHQIERGDRVSQATPPPLPTTTPQQPIKPIKLQYKFTGQCPNCKNDVRTIVNKFDDKWVASAYCLICDDIISQVEVGPIKEEIKEEIKKEKKK